MKISKKFIAWTTALTMLMSVLSSFGFSVFADGFDGAESGSGKDGDPYLISNIEQLGKLRDYVNGGNDGTGMYFELTDDIELGGESAPWTPIGDFSTSFSGTFDGGGHLISGLYINSEDSYLGLFGKLSGTVQNLGVSGEIVGSGSYVGGIAGYNGGTIENCYNISSLSGSGNVGGITGDNYYGEITNCYNAGAVNAANNVGGITGFNRGTIEKCYSSGAVSSSSPQTSTCGAIAGRSIAGEISDCYYLMNTAGGGISGSDQAGGTKVLSANDIALSDSFSGWDFDNTWEMNTLLKRPTLKSAPQPLSVSSKAELESLASYVNSGGGSGVSIVLTADIDLGCSAEKPWTPIGTEAAPFSGTFDGGGHTISGLYTDQNSDYQGLFGYAAQGSAIRNFGITDGSVSGSGGSVGTIAGYSAGEISRCYSAASSSGGGIVGNNAGEVSNCYNIGDAAVGGIAASNSGSISNCYNTGKSGSGIAGSSSGTVTGCYYLSSSASGGIAGSDPQDGVKAVSSADLAKKDTFSGWDFDAVWEIGAFARPVLRSVPERVFASGSGSEKDPYIIDSVSALIAFASYVNNGNGKNEFFDLKNDIDLGGADNNFTPIGNATAKFGGTFDGGGHKISGLNINSGDDDQGLFGYIDRGASVKGLTVEGSVKGKDNVGGIAGQTAGTIESCHNTCDITGTNNVGGIAGQTVKNGDLVGGVLQYNYNSGAVSGEDTVGGVVGNNQYITQDSYNIGNVSGTNNVGGIAGQNSGTLWRVYNKGTVSCSGSSVGGAIGSTSGIVNYTYYLDSCGAEGSGDKLTLEQLSQKGSFSGFDFDGVWTIDLTINPRPVLKSNSEPVTFASGKGTAEDPFEIPDLETLERFSGYNSLPSQYFELTNDIDMSKEYGDGKKSWTPIGSSNTKFNCAFLGNGHRISGLYINSDSNDQGLFGYIADGASVKDLTVAGSVKGKDNVGGIAGQNEGTIESCNNECDITGANNIGGIAGMNNVSDIEGQSAGTIKSCNNKSDITGTSCVGGITGVNSSEISSCTNSAAVSGSDCGGIVAYNYGKLENCENHGSVSGANVIGGIASVNDHDDTILSGCANYGTVSGGSSSGGIVGNNYRDLDNCDNYGSVSGNDAVGGVAGHNSDRDHKIENCSNSGAINTENYGGGIAGENVGQINMCYNNGRITIESNAQNDGEIGGIAGYNITMDIGILGNDATIQFCYNTGDVISNKANGAAGGIAGRCGRDTAVSFCYNVGNIKGGKYNGGIDGMYEMDYNPFEYLDGQEEFLQGSIDSCYNYGNTEGEGIASLYEGTLDVDVSFNDSEDYRENANINNCYTLFGVSQYTSNATVLSAEEFKSLASSFSTGMYGDNMFLGRPILYANRESGFGVDTDPYIISSLSALESFRNFVNSGYDDTFSYYKLTVDIDMSDKYGEDKESWKPIEADIGGTFDGGGHTISGLYINSTEDDQALFKYVFGTIKNLRVEGTVKGNNVAAGIVGYIQGAIENCRNDCTVSGTTYVGGIAAVSYGGIGNKIINCFNSGSITGSDTYIGGIVGSNELLMQNCYNIGEIKGKDKVGSICYNIDDGPNTGTVTNCYYLENTGEDPHATAMTADEFKSGEATYLLQSGCDEPTWGQNGDFPELIAFNKNIKSIHKVTFESERPKVADVYIPDGEKLSVKDDYPYVKWSQTAPGSEQPEFDPSTPITSDMTLYLIEGREFEQSSDGDITLKAECGAPFEQDLLSLLKFADGSGITASDFEFELKDGSTLPSSFTLEGGKLKSDCVVSDIGKYSVTFNVTDKKPYSNIALAALDPNPAEFLAELTITLDVNFKGGGTADSPYEIPNLEALEAFRNYVNARKGSGEYFELTADIDMSGKYGDKKASWTPIGSYNKEFNGTFDGDGHTISGLYINTTDDYQGLFGAVDKDCTIKNLGVRGTVAGGFYTSGIVGYVEYGTIENCKNDCAVSGKTLVGGVAGGTYYGNVINCFNSGAVTGSDMQIGGVAGSNAFGTVQNCYNVGEISGEDLVCGICDNDGTVTDCYYLDGTHEDPNAKKMTADEFKSGKAAWLLQSACDEPTWGQKLGTDDYPILTSDAAQKVVKVTFSTNDNAAYAESYTNAGGKVTLPDDPDIDGAEFEMWSASSAAPFEEFTADTSVNEDTVVHSVGRDLFGGESDAISLSGTYGVGITADLSQYIKYKNGASVSGNFRYTISDEGQTEATINGSMLAIPKNTNAGSYTLTVTAEEKEPIYSLASIVTFGKEPVTLKINVNIAKADPVVVVKSANALYDDDPEPDDLVTGTTSGGTLQYSTDGETYTEEIPKAHEAGEYTVWYKVVGDNNYNDTEPKSIKVKIAHGFADVTVKPSAITDLVFSGEPQELITAGSGTNGEMQYSLDGENYSTEIPTGTAAGQYTVWYKMVGGFIDGKHYHDSEAASLTAVIGKLDSTVESSGADVVYGDTLTLTAEISKADFSTVALAAAEDKVDFYIGETLLGSADVNYDDAALKDGGTATLTVTADKKLAIGSNTVRAEYGGSVNLNGSGNDSITVTMSQKPLEYTVTARNKTYDGSAAVEVELTPINNGKDDVKLTAKGAAPSANAGSYETVDLSEIAISGADAGYYTASREKNGVKLTSSAAISKAESSVKTPPTANDLTYNGEAQELVSAVKAEDEILVYSLDKNGDYGEKIPTGINAGDYIVWYKVTGDSNHNDSVPQSIYVKIAKADPVVVVKSANALYDDDPEPDELVIGSTSGGTLQYSTDGETYTEEIPKAHEAGEYTVWYKVVGDNNYNDTEPKSIKVKIAHGFADVTVKPSAITDLVFSGEPQELITAGSGTNGEMQYSLDGENYSTEIPTGTAAGQYTVWYKMVGGFIDGKHYHDSEADSLTAVIEKLDSTVESSGADVVYGDTLTLTAKISKADYSVVALAAAEDKVDFYNGETLLGSADVNYDDAVLKDSGTATLTVTADKKLAIGANTIRAEYGGSVNLNGSGNDSITVTMSQKPLEYTVTARNKTYDGSAAVEVELTPINNGKDDVKLTAKGAAPSANAGSYETVDLSEIAISGADAGYYTTSREKSGVELTTSAAISKAESSVKTPPTANKLTYSGEEQELVSAGKTEDGTLVYSLEQKGEYGENIPTGINAGDYTVWYKVIGDSNHNDSAPQSLSVTIARQDEFDYIIRSAELGADGKLNIDLEYQEKEPKAAKLIVASYDAEGILTQMKEFDISGANVDLGGYAPNGDIIKLFIWSGFGDMTPLAVPYEIK